MMGSFNNLLGIGSASIPSFAPLILLFALWAIFWKGLALWHSAQKGQYWWFVIMLVLNTAGILEIIYLFAVLKLKLEQLFSSAVQSAESASKDTATVDPKEPQA